VGKEIFPWNLVATLITMMMMMTMTMTMTMMMMMMMMGFGQHSLKKSESWELAWLRLKLDGATRLLSGPEVELA
jgi:hypothetical protein